MSKNISNNYYNNNSRKEASLMLVKQCPLCNSNYFPDQLVILEEDGVTYLAHLNCRNCGSNLIIRVFASPHGLIGTASITDLIANEVVSLNGSGEVTADEILELVELISKNKLINNLTIN